MSPPASKGAADAKVFFTKKLNDCAWPGANDNEEAVSTTNDQDFKRAQIIFTD